MRLAAATEGYFRPLIQPFTHLLVTYLNGYDLCLCPLSVTLWPPSLRPFNDPTSSTLSITSFASTAGPSSPLSPLPSCAVSFLHSLLLVPFHHLCLFSSAVLRGACFLSSSQFDLEKFVTSINCRK